MTNRSIDNQNKDIKRVTVSFTQELYDYIEQIAQEKKVSLAWVVREAVEVYMSENKNGL
jgi:metal-responsive CopG/Arc/MetJ family transcriptional regulator